MFKVVDVASRIRNQRFMPPDPSLCNYFESVMNEKNPMVDDLKPSMIKQRQWERSSCRLFSWISASDHAYAQSKGMQRIVQRTAKGDKNELSVCFADFRCLRILKGVPMLICESVCNILY